NTKHGRIDWWATGQWHATASGCSKISIACLRLRSCDSVPRGRVAAWLAALSAWRIQAPARTTAGVTAWA
ncbi:hypothetical protein L2221_24810, partial [Xanthomonas perforans]|nr:hypothetical protein [Xanthomonas perforans]